MITLSIPRRLRGPTRADSMRNPDDELANRTFDTTGGRVPAGGVLSVVDGANRHPRPRGGNVGAVIDASGFHGGSWVIFLV